MSSRVAQLSRLLVLSAKGIYGSPTPGITALSDGAGEIVELGPGVRRWKVGDRVVSAYYPTWHGGTIRPDVGMVAGHALDDANTDASTRDRELDATIGVTQGSLGERERASEALSSLERTERAGGSVPIDGSMSRAGERLRREHRRLEKCYEALLDAYKSGDFTVVRAQWEDFEPAVRGHMDAEEMHILPRVRPRRRPRDERAARGSRRTEKLLDTIGVGLELYAVSSRTMEEIIERLRAHGAREERLLYPWADAELRSGAASAA